MHGPTIAADDLEAWARTPLEHSLGGIAPGERVMIKGERIAWPLMAVLEREGVMNRSAQHVDVVADVRPRGCGRRVFIDDTEIVVPNRVWVPRREPAGPGDPARVATSIGTERGVATC